MTARRKLIAALSEDSMGGIATLSDVEHAEQLVDALSAEVRTATLNEALFTIDAALTAGGIRRTGLLTARKRLIALRDGLPIERPRKTVSHPAVAEKLRAQPGQWLLVGEYSNDQSAAGIAWAIKSGGGRITAYRPAGAFETRTESAQTGTRVFARFVGEGGAS